MVKGYNTCRVPKKSGRNIVVPEKDFSREKWCPNCRTWLHIEKDFYSNVSRHDGAGEYCKKCDNKRRVERSQNAKSISRMSI